MEKLGQMWSCHVGRIWICRGDSWRRKWQPTPVFLPGESCGQRSLVGCHLWGHRVRPNWSDLACMHALEKEMATHSSVLAWGIPGTGEPGGLPSMGSHRVGPDWSDLAAAAAEGISGRTYWIKSFLKFFWGDIDLYHYRSVICMTLDFHFCIQHSLVTTESFRHHRTVNLYPFHPALHFASLVTATLLSLSMCLFGLFICFVSVCWLVFIFQIQVNSYLSFSIWLK